MYDSDFYDQPGDDELETDVVDCPACGAEVYEDAIRCPVCGEYITHSSSVWAGRSPWWIALGLAGVIAVIFALAF